MKLTTLVIAAALAAGCSVHGDERSFMVGTKVVPATPSTAANAIGCVYDATTPENVFGAFDPAFGYVHAVVVENRMVDNASLGPGRIGTNDFQVEGATITTDVRGGDIDHADVAGRTAVKMTGVQWHGGVAVTRPREHSSRVGMACFAAPHQLGEQEKQQRNCRNAGGGQR